MLSTLIIKEIIFSGIRFQYESYDFKKALAEVEALNATQQPSPYRYGVPDEIKKNHIVWRTGKLWEVEFWSNGEIKRIKISRHWNYQKSFNITDFGIKFKPCLFKSDDKYDLIKQGLAVEEIM